MRRLSSFALVLLTGVLVVLFGNVPRAFADRPDKQPLPAESFTISGECAFDVQFEVLTNKEKLSTFYDKDGDIRFLNITGALRVRFINLETGKSVDLNISGPLRIEPQPDGSTLITYLGAGGLFFPPNESDLPPIAFTHGPVVTQVDAEGNFSVISVKGHVEDVCAMLAAG
jgi:hypothetical protein